MKAIEQYIEEYSSAGTEAERALLDELERVTNLKVIQPQMVSGRVQGAFLTLITRMLRPRRVLEIGTFTGYSALSIAAGLDEGAEIHTVEIDDELEDIARSFFERSAHGHKIHLHIGSTLELVPQLVARQLDARKPEDGRVTEGESARIQTAFDLIYIDGDKREYPDYYRMVMGDVGAPAMVRQGGILLTDNVLWYGKVVGVQVFADSLQPHADVSTEGNLDRHTAGIVEFNRMVAADPRVENVILPLRDGVNLIRVK